MTSSRIPIPKNIYNLTKRLRTLGEVEQYFPELRAFIDATEQEIPRPKDKEKKTHYSGKRKKHTVKTQLTVNSNGLIVHRANHARGRRHDLGIYLEHHPSLPKEVEQDFDRGYDGIRNYFPDLNCAIPFKRRSTGRGHKGEKARELTPEQKSFNKKTVKGKSRCRAHHKQAEKVQHLRSGIQEQIETLRFYDRHRIRADQFQDTGQ